MTEISPAILTNDISDFRKKYAELFALSHHFTKLHVDFADNHFVPNETILPSDLGFLKSSRLNLVAHLMCYDPRKYFIDLKKNGFAWILFHYEVFPNDVMVENTIYYAINSGLKPGLVLNPETPINKIKYFLNIAPMIQLMGIHPGFQGSEFLPETIDRIKELRNLSKSVIIAVDGGIKVGIARQCAKSGADILVAGSAILRSQNEEMAVEALQADIEK